MGYSTQEQEQFLFKVHDWFRSDVRRGTGTETIWRTERRTWVKDLYYKGLFSGILDILERSLARCLVIKHLSLWRNLKEPWKGLYHLTTWDIVYFCLSVNWREKIRTELPTIHWNFKVALKLSVVFLLGIFTCYVRMMWDKSMCSSEMLQHSLKQYSHINMQIILSDWLWESYWDGKYL